MPVAPNTQQNIRMSRLLQLQAEAMFATDKPVDATALLVKREQYLTSPEAIADNRDEIWSGLMQQVLTPAHLKGLDASDRLTRGWISLARLAQQHASVQQYAAWQQQYPQHPGNAQLPSLMMAGSASAALGTSRPFTMPAVGNGPAALVLPLTGSLATAAQMIKQGFDREEEALHLIRPPARVYDDSTQGDQDTAVIQQALDAGAGIIIGPLQKQSVSALAQQGTPDVPVLALNYLPTGIQAPSDFMQFGLAPADEARQAATDAYAHGLKRAVALVPDNDRGGRILAAFETRLEQLGGTVVASTQYSPGADNFSPYVRSLLDIDASIARAHAVARAIGEKPHFVPRRRQDIDFIFISGGTTEDRLMVSMFRYWHAVHLPIYATADVNTGRGDNDLVGVHFCDSPWISEPGPEWDAVRDQIEEASHGLGSGYQRLYALGMDAARLTARLRQGSLRPGEEITGYTGELSIDSNGVVQRHLACAQIVADAPPRSTDATILPVPGLGTSGVPDEPLPGQSQPASASTASPHQ